jgi:HTH-type transcriptional regulator/antitoxin HigA
MGFAALKKKAHDLFEQARFIGHINNKSEYEDALVLMDELIENYDYNKSLIEILSISIERWENNAAEFAAFNKRIRHIGSAKAILKVLMDQYHLGTADLPEIGSKSLVSRILNDERRLTIDHIKALSKRFKIDPRLFI